MIFDTYEFLVFFLLVYGVHFCLKGHRSRNLFLLGASYFFYGFWSWKFLALLLATQVIDFNISKAMHRLPDSKNRTRLMWLSVAVNMGTLGFFKYFNFFTENLQHALRFFNLEVSEVTLNIVLPAGISFYTIQELTYVLDVYKRRFVPTRKFAEFSLFVSFFPQLVAGPIERAEHLLPQIQNPRVVAYRDFMDGCWLIFWGLFKKILVADRLALLVDAVFSSPGSHQPAVVAMGAVAFTFQIYADFSGYSDMAVGLGRMFGFKLMYNFNLPLLAHSPSDFWRRWHISLSQFLRDYLYIPLGGNRRGFSRELVALMTTMLIGGLWHGARWNFIIWGGYCGLLLVGERLYRKGFGRERRAGRGEAKVTFPERPAPVLDDDSGNATMRTGRPWRFRLIPAQVLMLVSTVVGFVIFRVQSAADLPVLARRIFQPWAWTTEVRDASLQLLLCVSPLVIHHVVQYWTNDRYFIFRVPVVLRAVIYVVLWYLIAFGAPSDVRAFIYFQF